MIVDIPDTTTSKVSKKLAELREDGGVVALTFPVHAVDEGEESSVPQPV